MSIDQAVTEPPTATKRMSSDERREQIIEAAIAVFGSRGYVGATTDDVARAASVSQPYVVRLFGTKEKLFLAALRDVLDQLLATFRAAVRDDSDPEKPIHARIGHAYIGLMSVRGLHQFLSQAFLLGGHPVIGPAARAGFSETWAMLRDEAGMSPDEARDFLSMGMLINTMFGLRITEAYGADAGMTELFDSCFDEAKVAVLAEAPRADEAW